MDLKIRIFRDRIARFIDGSDLPVEVKLLCFRDFCNQLENAAMQEINRQAAERDKAQKEAEKAAEVAQAATEAGEPDE